MMKKILFLVGLCSAHLVIAQIPRNTNATNHPNYTVTSPENGKVGLNTESAMATLHIEVSPEHTGLNTHTNEGIIIPRLTKERVYAISKDQLRLGTLIFVYGKNFNEEGSDYTSPMDKIDDKHSAVGNIDSEGFYYFNGMAWEKISTPQKAIKLVKKDYTITNADNGKTLLVNSDSDVTLDINYSLIRPHYLQCNIIQIGTGKVNIVYGTYYNPNNKTHKVRTTGKNAQAKLIIHYDKASGLANSDNYVNTVIDTAVFPKDIIVTVLGDVENIQ